MNSLNNDQMPARISGVFVAKQDGDITSIVYIIIILAIR